jgi:hypothetical protein
VSPVTAPTSRGGLFLRTVVAGIALAVVGIVVAAIGVGLPGRSPGPAWVRGAAMSVVHADGPVFVRSADAFLVAVSPGRAIAISARSPQMGEPVRYCSSDGWFEDPAHGSKFDGLGRYVLGPAPHGLDRFAVRYVDGVVWIDPAAVTEGAPRGTRHTPPTGPFCVPSA